MATLGLDTIYWTESYGLGEIFVTGDRYEITETKDLEWRLWDTVKVDQIDICETLDEAKEAAELDKQKRAIAQ